MSDLLPLVVAALNDKVAAESQEELTKLRKGLELSQSIEIIRAANNGKDEDEDENTIVYASTQFQDGEYAYNPNLWQVNLEPCGSTTCRLTNLRNCQICVGGGFPIASLDDEMPNSPPCDGFLDPDLVNDGDNSKAVSFCFSPNSLWLIIVIHGWPREDWEQIIQANTLAPEDSIRFLVETLAPKYPEASVEFKSVSFVVPTIHGALKRLLPPKRKELARADRDSKEDYSSLVYNVTMTMRNQGNQNSSALFIPQMNEVIESLEELGIREWNRSNEELITGLVTLYENAGQEGLHEVIRRLQYGDEEDETRENS